MVKLQMSEDIKPIIVPSYTEEKGTKKKFFRFENLKKKKAKKQVKKQYVLRKTPELVPFLKYGANENIVMKNDLHMDLFQITPKDLQSLTDEELEMHVLLEARFNRSTTAGYKIIALNFPSNMEKQRQYWLRKKERATSPLQVRFIDRKIFEFNFLEQERPNREFFLFLYAPSEQLLEDLKNQAIRGMRQTFPLQKLTVDKKQDVLFLLNNPNSKL